MITGVRSRNAPPKASAMLESLRGLGYSTGAALADIVDNSIAAGAKSVSLNFIWRGELSVISILDDGEGMTASELDTAMRLGEKDPTQDRASHDLGRFGLGLKTASFSQCRRLTVASRKNGVTNCLRWDLDVLARSTDNGWHLLEEVADGSEQFIKPLDSLERGTIVVWEVLDRIVTIGYTEQNFLDVIDRVEQHLAMVFHRYLERSQRLSIVINGRLIAPWDPFLLNHSATWSSPVERFQTPGGEIEVQCHVLPHRDRLGRSEYETVAGPEGWTAQQGFYVYRNQRLLIAGSWLGLGGGRSWTKEEAHRLARIRIDIPNTADAEWKIDIRKSTARPPVILRQRLTRLAEDTRGRARRVFAHRGRIVRMELREQMVQAWRAEYRGGSLHYRIDENHIAVKAVLDDAGHLGSQVRAMLRIIEETVPVQRIWLDTTEGREVPRTGFAGDTTLEVSCILNIIYRNMVLKKGVGSNRAKEILMSMEPFYNYPDLVAELPDVPDSET